MIDENSQDLPLGHHRLHVEEITDRNMHFGRDAVFRMTLPFSEQGSIDICTLNAGRRNKATYRECLRLGGRWEPILGEWVFSASQKDKVNALQKIIISEPVTVEVTFKETISQPEKNLTIFGFELIKGLNIDFTPIFHKGVQVKKGDLSFIVGKSSKSIARAGTVVRISVPKLMLNDDRYKENYSAALNYRIIRSRRKTSS
ncbi:hypothetical protein [Vibrio parahaemolyticus]|uniref:hypothetical protein n=1 Tax=Vibrio parahaemolyticus TaxID=670 RepID=UPI0012AE0B85|nr:hypothetical protein [Vibrio parahaemolyticus]EJE4555859.1 hypothetical protein [Vibrio parahaemolyticus]HCH4863101.1 hypothetical protein [Vibrio parahaemolyticus]HCH4867553.1 hypothetical protein [Vibrio parahaemolyticus]